MADRCPTAICGEQRAHSNDERDNEHNPLVKEPARAE
jgi:hypothetical protein